MTTATIRIPAPLRPYTDGRDEVDVPPGTVGGALAVLVERHPDLTSRLLDDRGQVRRFVHVFVGSDDVAGREGLATEVGAGDVLSIVPAVAGGVG